MGNQLFRVFLFCCIFSKAALAVDVNPVIQITDQVLHPLDDRLFGQFLERPSWAGETGPESIADENGHLPDEITSRLREMGIPIIRFPGGTDIDYIDWTDMISNVPGRRAERPVTVGHQKHKVTNRFGYDEYAELAADMGWESIIVVNLLDALAKRKPLEEAAQHVAGLVAYCNAPLGAELPAGMPDWPAVRAKNGHPEPYNFRIFQLGNEWGVKRFKETVQNVLATENPAELAPWYIECIAACADAMHEVDPELEIIMDAMGQPGIPPRVLAAPELKDKIDYVAIHSYGPWSMDSFKRDGEEIDAATLSQQEIYTEWSGYPGRFDAQGRNIAFEGILDMVRSNGYTAAITEWNWNAAGYSKMDPRPEFPWQHAAMVGAGSFINGLIRNGDVIHVTNQSMLVGYSWDISAIRYDLKKEMPTHYNAQGAATTFYNRHHGAEVLAVNTTGIPIIDSGLVCGKWGRSEPAPMALIDAVASRDADHLFVHMACRAYSKDVPVELDLSELITGNGTATLHILEGAGPDQVAEKRAWTQERSVDVQIENGIVRTSIPRRSLAILEAGL